MIEADVIIAFKKTHRRINEIMRTKIADFNLTFRLFHLLKLIKDSPEASQKDLATKLQLTQGAVSGSIKRLLKLEMIKQIPLEADNRYNKLEITKKGSKVIEEYFESLNDRFKMMFADFSEEDLIQFNKSLILLNQNLDKINAKYEREGV